MATRAKTQAEAEAAYRVGYAKALLTADHKTVSDREAAATIACEQLLLDRKIAEALADTTKEAGRTLRANSTLRSITNAVTGGGL
jgi:hypothetical protein